MALLDLVAAQSALAMWEFRQRLPQVFAICCWYSVTVPPCSFISRCWHHTVTNAAAAGPRQLYDSQNDVRLHPFTCTSFTFVFCFVLIGFTTEPCLRDKQNQCLSDTHNIRRAGVRGATPPPNEIPTAQQQGTFSVQSAQALFATSPSGGS